MELLIFKTLHIIGFVAWFSGLFYLGRLFVYSKEAEEKPDFERKVLQDQYYIMQQRVYKIICNPAMMITWIGGLSMLYIYGLEWMKVNAWIHSKLLLVIILTLYHLFCKKQIFKLQEGKSTLTSFHFRLLNEVPTLLLFAIVIFAVFKNISNAFIVLGLTVLFGTLLVVFTKWYKKVRQRKQTK